VNILLFHGLMNPAGFGLALLVTILWGVVFVSVKSAFAGIFQARVDMKTAPARRPAGLSALVPQPPNKSSNGNKHMKNILLIQTSPRGSESYSQRVANSIVNEIKDRNSSTTVTFRDLAEDTLPHVGPAFISALSAKPEELTAAQSDALALSDGLIEELQTADIVVLAVPMHNFGIPSTLKAWIDHVVRAGRTFTYSQGKPEGLLEGKRLILVLASGGVYSDGPAKQLDFTEPYLRAVLGFIGLTDIEVVRVEGVAMSTIGAEKAVATATAHSREILARAA
jgi:FMN-dependent NADH-azoreductase